MDPCDMPDCGRPDGGYPYAMNGCQTCDYAAGYGGEYAAERIPAQMPAVQVGLERLGQIPNDLGLAGAGAGPAPPANR